jgi:MFS family permease
MNHLKHFFTSREAISIGAAFVVMGFLFGNWATMIPYIKYTYGLSDGQLGLLLLSMPLGCLAFNYWAAVLANKYGMREMTVFGMVTLSLAYAIPMSVKWLYIVPIGLVLAGICVTILNIAMNMTAAAFEQSQKKYILSTCHGLFSAGLMLGSIMRSVTLPMGISDPSHMFLMCGLMILITVLIYNRILVIPIKKQEAKEVPSLSFEWPTGALLTMILISLCTNVTEGSMADWATLYMKDIVKSDPIYYGWGLSSYSAFMALGRFSGDSIIPKYGPNKILVWGAITTFVGLCLAILLPNTVVTMIGFGFVGLGVSLGSPILYGSSARYPDIPNGGGLALMNTFSMAGFLIGPVLIGYISDISNLSVAFGFVAALSIFWIINARSAKLY